MGFGEWDGFPSVPETSSATALLRLTIVLDTVPNRASSPWRVVSSWYLFLVAVLEIPNRYLSLRDLNVLNIHNHASLTGPLGLELQRPPADSSFRSFGPPEKTISRPAPDQENLPNQDCFYCC